VFLSFFSVAAKFHAAPLALLIFRNVDEIENALIARAFTQGGALW
jgi:hypothetical protein